MTSPREFRTRRVARNTMNPTPTMTIQKDMNSFFHVSWQLAMIGFPEITVRITWPAQFHSRSFTKSHKVAKLMPPSFCLLTHTRHVQFVSLLDLLTPFRIWRLTYHVVINIHGGAFMLGASEMVNQEQIKDCLDRGWIVVVPNHRLCPQVDLLEGPMQDCRDLLDWVYNHELERFVHQNGYPHMCDLAHVFAFGTSSGGHLALSLVSPMIQSSRLRY